MITATDHALVAFDTSGHLLYRHISLTYLSKLIFVLLPALVPILLCKYGLEIADSGWAAVLTRDYFTYPEMVGRASPWFLTWTIGALLSHGGVGQVSHLRVIAFLPILVSSLSVWILFSAYNHRTWFAAFGAFVSGLASYASLYFINYNTISSAFAVLAIATLLLSKRVCDGKLWQIAAWLLAGVFASYSIMSRLASLTVLVPATYVIVASYHKNYMAYVAFYLGLAIGTVSVVVFALHTGHLSYVYANTIAFLRSAISAHEQSSHPAPLILFLYVRTAAFHLAQASVLFVLSSFCYDEFRNGKHLSSAIACLALAFIVKHVWHDMAQAFAMFTFIAGVLALKACRIDRSLTPIAVAGALFLFLFPLGSTGGIRNICFSLWFLVPAAIVAIKNGRERVALLLMSAITSIVLTVDAVCNPYWDSATSRLTSEVDGGFAAGIRTTRDRKLVLDEVVAAISQYATRGEEIFVYQNSPLLYMLSGTRPWIPFPWPYLISASDIASSMAAKETQSLPRAIVRERLSPFNKLWPNTDELPLEDVKNQRLHGGVYERFIEKHGYRVVFENRMFEVLAR